MSALEQLSEEESYLVAILQDQSGVDLAEYSFRDPNNPDGLFRCWDYQIAWFRNLSKRQVDRNARATGKSISIQLRACAHIFNNPSQEMLITAPEMIHLDPVTKYIEDRIEASRLTREMLKIGKGKTGFKHRPFEAEFKNGSRILGRIPHRDGAGVKGIHARWIEADEFQDYPPDGFTEIVESLRYGDTDARWRVHGVSKGVQDHFYKLTQSADWYVHKFTAYYRPDWSEEERKAKAELYGSRNHPDYRRNILGWHGDAVNSLFVVSRLMATVDTNEDSDYNRHEYVRKDITHEYLTDSGLPIGDLLEFPGIHKRSTRFWVGSDLGLTNHPTEILIFGEEHREGGGGQHPDSPMPSTRLKLLMRIHLERISAPDQIRVFEAIAEHYRPGAIAIDRTGLGLPIYQGCLESSNAHLVQCVRGYNFSEKIPVGFEPGEEGDEFYPVDPMDRAIMANVQEFAYDTIRIKVDKREVRLPYDVDLLREFTGQTYYTNKSAMSPYGKRIYSGGKNHCLDAAALAMLGFHQRAIEDLLGQANNQQATGTSIIFDNDDFGDYGLSPDGF